MEAHAAIAPALSAEDVHLRRLAAAALEDTSAAEAAVAISKAIDDEDATVRMNALWALGRLDPERAVPILARYLSQPEAEQRPPHMPLARVRTWAARALAHAGTPEAKQALLDAREQTPFHRRWGLNRALRRFP